MRCVKADTVKDEEETSEETIAIIYLTEGPSEKTANNDWRRKGRI